MAKLLSVEIGPTNGDQSPDFDSRETALWNRKSYEKDLKRAELEIKRAQANTFEVIQLPQSGLVQCA